MTVSRKWEFVEFLASSVLLHDSNEFLEFGMAQKTLDPFGTFVADSWIRIGAECKPPTTSVLETLRKQFFGSEDFEITR